MEQHEAVAVAFTIGEFQRDRADGAGEERDAGADENVTLIEGDAVAAVRELKSQTGKDIWLCGGGELAATLFPEIDELILKVNPLVLGSGISLFSVTVGHNALELAKSKSYNNGFMLLHYRVKH